MPLPSFLNAQVTTSMVDLLGVAPSQDSSDHQDYEPFLGSGIPN